MQPRPPALVRYSIAIYRGLLVLYPTSHRRDYGPLMLQLFRHLCRDSYTQRGWSGLSLFWLDTITDLIRSASTAHLRAFEEVLMAGTYRLTPMPWRKVLLVVAPGILFGISRIYAPLGQATGLVILLIAVLALAVLVTRKNLPAWGLLVLGLVTNYFLMMAVFIFPGTLRSELRIDFNTSQLLVAIPLWLAILGVAWKSKIGWGFPLWSWTLLFLGVLLVFTYKDFSVINVAAVMLLPVAIGLPLSRRHGALAVLFVVGAYSAWLLDSDTISGYLLRERAFYPYYAVLLSWLFISIGPLFFLRARSQIGRVIGLLVPIAAVMIGRVAVPWLLRPEFHPLRIWVNDALGSAFTLLMLALTLAMYARVELLQGQSPLSENGQLAYPG